LRSRNGFKSLRFIIQDFGELNTSGSGEGRGDGSGRDRVGDDVLATGRDGDEAEAKYNTE
jgi:hypothetical protein